jgi:hypothetical protein
LESDRSPTLFFRGWQEQKRSRYRKGWGTQSFSNGLEGEDLRLGHPPLGILSSEKMGLLLAGLAVVFDLARTPAHPVIARLDPLLVGAAEPLPVGAVDQLLHLVGR